jgi:2-polyprenyl-3-methyl-5-hydroxy-6-metoxy-1,4-benzoquinol methylase
VKLNRDLQRPFRFLLDQVLPPFVRDSFLMRYAMKIVFRKESETVWQFRKNFWAMSDLEVESIYANLSKYALKVSTDINRRCLDKIFEEMTDKVVLDVGCGTGKLAELRNYKSYVGVDFVEHELWKSLQSSNTTFSKMSADEMVFPANSVDLVVCAHVLEHVRNPIAVLTEISRITRSRAIVILPRERSYKSGFNLHVHHFRYDWEVRALLNQLPKTRPTIELIDGDFYCVIEFQK